MKDSYKFLAFDLGASSGRAILGTFNGSRIDLKEIHRFSNDPVSINGNLHWDILRLFYEIKQGILKASIEEKNIDAIGVDTWGVDFGLIDEKGKLLGNPYHYRDIRTEGVMDKVFEIIPKEEIFRETGIQFLWFNTIYQLYSMKLENSSILEKAKTFLMIPDLINYFLTGVKSTEYTNATTTQLFNTVTKQWSWKIIEKLNLPKEIFTNIINPGTIIGCLTEDIQKELNVSAIPVVSVASHDTGSAVAAVPAEDKNFAYISCGTWSLMGVELEKPIINESSMNLDITNEGGVEGTTRFLKNIMGLWLVQESKRQWEREGEKLTYSDLTQMAKEARPFENFIDPDYHEFGLPGDMPNRVRNYCRATNQTVPVTKGEVIRCITQSLALKYRYTIECLEKILYKKIDRIHIVGGGIQDKMLCQFTADATGKEVIAGPIEATAAGNIAVQAMALGAIKDLNDARRIIRNSFQMQTYKPQNTQEWDKVYEKFIKLIK
ncbi:rhamnulokinase [Caloramator sp. E03]|nr:rhamnulokinase [Caloramator sp. E03]